MPELSVLIVSYRCWSRLDDCLKSLGQQQDVDLEVIVVDNHSNDGMAKDFVKGHPKVIFDLQEINGGFSQGCNKGVSHAHGKWLLFLNPDTVLEPGTLRKLLDRAEQETDWKLIGIRQVDEKGRDNHAHGVYPTWWNIWPPARAVGNLLSGKGTSRDLWSQGEYSFPEFLSGSFILIRAHDLRELGGWDERFWMYNEDIDLCYRAHLKGWKVVAYNAIQCTHQHGGSSRINPKVRAIAKSANVISLDQYIRKHFSLPAMIAGKTVLFITRGLELLLMAPFSAVRRNMLVLLTRYAFTGKQVRGV